MLLRCLFLCTNSVSAPSAALSSQLLSGENGNVMPTSAPHQALPPAASSSSSTSSHEWFHTVGSDVSEGEAVKDVLVVRNGLGEGTHCEHKVARRTELNRIEQN
jgi:hypothetical protein